jgi:uncharacterized Zn finger protein
MVNAKLHIICGNCGCSDMFTYEIEKDGMDFGTYTDDAVYISCKNCSTLHNLEDNAEKEGRVET